MIGWIVARHFNACITFGSATLTNGNEITVDLMDYPVGIYFLKANTDQGAIKRKFIKR
jgi:hypothetical protein